MRIKKKADAITALVLLGVMAGLYQATDEFSMGAFSFNTPQFFPILLISIISLLSLALLFFSIDFSSEGQKEPSSVFKFSYGTLLQIFVVIFLAVYIAVLPLIGYLPATIIFLFVSMAVLEGKRDLKTLAIFSGISFVTTGVIWFLFVRMLQLFLP